MGVCDVYISGGGRRERGGFAHKDVYGEMFMSISSAEPRPRVVGGVRAVYVSRYTWFNGTSCWLWLSSMLHVCGMWYVICVFSLQ